MKHVLTNTYFLNDGSFFRQENGVAIGFLLTPVVANFDMEHFEQTAISTAIYKPTRWYRYVDDTFVVWPHGKRVLQELLKHLNGIHENTKFTVKIENGALPFLDILVTRRLDGILGHTVCRKPAHAELYLHAKSEHDPAR
jgi:hypothetical protein